MNTNKVLEMFVIETLNKIYQMKIIRECARQQYLNYINVRNINNKNRIINKFDNVLLEEFKELIEFKFNRPNDLKNNIVIQQILNIFNEI